MSWGIKPYQDPRRAQVDADALRRELERGVAGEARFDAATLALYTCDASNYRHVPLGVVLPRNAEDVVKAVAVCRRFGAPIVSRGGGTALAGQTCNRAVVFDHSKYFNRILEINVQERYARVEPGVVLDHLRARTTPHNLTYGPDPATHTHCTLGGMIGNNSCGIHSVMAGKTVDNVLELEVLTYDGLRMKVGPTSDEELERIISGQDRRGEIYRAMREIRDVTRHPKAILTQAANRASPPRNTNRRPRRATACRESAADRPCHSRFR
jgi:FAD/FMN-containing dehydrogenase